MTSRFNLPPGCTLSDLSVRLSNQPSLFKDGRLIVWFSCGAASACALKLVAHLGPLAVYCDTSANEHPDNARFRADVEQWTGIKIQVIKSEKFRTCEEVWEDRQLKLLALIIGTLSANTFLMCSGCVASNQDA